MISTTGRMPVIAAPTAIPVKPGSEIGVSSTRSGPNSSTRPARTLNTVPASAISSPQMKTRESRRISSESASRTASPKVNSRVSGINILIHLIGSRVRSVDRKSDRFLNFRFHFGASLFQCGPISDLFRRQPVGCDLYRITLGLPHQLFLFRAVVVTLHIADVMSVEPVRVANEEERPGASAHAIHNLPRRGIDLPHILAIDRFARDAEA